MNFQIFEIKKVRIAILLKLVLIMISHNCLWDVVFPPLSKLWFHNKQTGRYSLIRFRRFRSRFSDKIKFVNVDGALQFSRDLGQQEEASKQDLMEQVRYVQIP